MSHSRDRERARVAEVRAVGPDVGDAAEVGIRGPVGTQQMVQIEHVHRRPRARERGDRPVVDDPVRLARAGSAGPRTRCRPTTTGAPRAERMSAAAWYSESCQRSSAGSPGRARRPSGSSRGFDLPHRVLHDHDVGIERRDRLRPLVGPVGARIGRRADSAERRLEVERAAERARRDRVVLDDGPARLHRPQLEPASERLADRVADDEHAQRPGERDRAVQRCGRRRDAPLGALADQRGAVQRGGRQRARVRAHGREHDVGRGQRRRDEEQGGDERGDGGRDREQRGDEAAAWSRGGKRPVSTGRSRSTNDAIASASVIATRTAKSGAGARPVRSGVSHRKIGQWYRYTPYETRPSAASGRHDSTRANGPSTRAATMTAAAHSACTAKPPW